MMRALLVALLMVASGSVWANDPQARFKGTNPVSVSGLADENGCFPAKLNGRVVKRSFADNGVSMVSVTVEERTGERSLINVDDDKLKNASMAARSDAMRAMQILLREGSRVSLGVFACGAAGRVMMLDSIRLAR